MYVAATNRKSETRLGSTGRRAITKILPASKQIRLRSVTSSEYASRILFTEERGSKVYDSDGVRDLLIARS